MSTAILAVIGMATATGVLGAYVLRELMRGRRPVFGIYLQLAGTAVLTVYLHLDAIGRDSWYLWVLGVGLLVSGLLMQSRLLARVDPR
jgi:hypothetical protein